MLPPPTQVKVKKGAPIIGQGIRDIGFRGRFNAAVIAVKRSKVRQPGRLGDLALQAADVLVLSTGHLFDPTRPNFVANFEK
jgi:K+/H+ antiporter YhaU regulatory subunit KhtT